MKKPTVLVLGGGISGTASALWIDHVLGESAQIILAEQTEKLFLHVKPRHSIGSLGYGIESLIQVFDGLPPGGAGHYWLYPHVEEEVWVEQLWKEAVGDSQDEISAVSLTKVLSEKLEKSAVTVYTSRKGESWTVTSDQRFCMWFRDGNPIEADYLIFAVGGGRPGVLKSLPDYGISLTPTLPGFRDFRLEGNQWKGVFGFSSHASKVKLIFGKDVYEAPGGELFWKYPYLGGKAISGATIKWAEVIAEHHCCGILEVSLLPEGKTGVSGKEWAGFQSDFGSREVGMVSVFDLPLPLWRALLAEVGIEAEEAWNKLESKRLARLGSRLFCLKLPFRGYRLNKTEHFRVGGVPPHELKMDYMESLKQPNLFFCGEVVDLRMPPGGAGYHYGLWSGLRAGAAIVERLQTKR